MGKVFEIVETLGPNGAPPYRVKAENGHETIGTRARHYR
ncbi:DUF1918 domain-containing protein [Streptomyces sp. A1547]|nr:DUF1918 domain-containing protein [Streptomyces sp. A1547]